MPQLICVVLWRIRHERNKLVFEKKPVDPKCIAGGTVEFVG